MNTVAKLTQKQIEKLAVEIRTFLLEHDMWVDTQIYFNGKCFDTHDKETGEFYYNDPEHLVVRENEDPRRYFENVAEDHILSMAFEGTVCHMLWYGTNPGIKKKFDRIFERTLLRVRGPLEFYLLLHRRVRRWHIQIFSRQSLIEQRKI